jgi:hypothetical protein
MLPARPPLVAGGNSASATVKTASSPVTERILRTAGCGAASSSSPPRSRARRSEDSSTFMPVESQNSTPDMSTTTRGAWAARAMTPASSLCSRGAV